MRVTEGSKTGERS